MINDLNEIIFNYIFSINEEIENKIIEDNQDDYCIELDKLISKTINPYDFWNEYKNCINKNCLLDVSTFAGNKYQYINFPRMTLESKNDFYRYKCSRIIKIIEDNGTFNPKLFGNLFENISNFGIKKILDYCEKEGIIKYNGNPYFSADDNPASTIMYENIEAKLFQNENNNIQQIVNNFYGNNYGNINQSINNFKDDDIYNLILDKLEVIKIESNATDQKIDELSNYCKQKEKNKVISILKEFTMGVTTNIVASAILGMFGIGV